jgi:hypothetical protein
MNLRCLWFAAIFCALPPGLVAGDSLFTQKQVTVPSSPGEVHTLAVAAGEKVVDFDVWPSSPEAVVLVRAATNDNKVLFWDLAAPEPQKGFDLPHGVEGRAIVCHRAARQVFVLAREGPQFEILRFADQSGTWTSSVVYKSASELRRLSIGSRPFRVWDAAGKTTSVQYRLFFGIRSGQASYAVHSVTERGEVEYQVLGPQATISKFPDSTRPS